MLSRAGVVICALVSGREETISSKRECSNNQHAHQQDHGRHKDGDDLGHGLVAYHRATRLAGVIDDGNRDTPPGENGVEGRCQEPGSEQIPNLGRLITSFFRREDAGDTGKVNATEGESKDACPGQRTEG